MKEKLENTFEKMCQYQHQRKKASLRSAVYVIVLKRVEQMIEMRGAKEYFTNSVG